MSDLEILEKKDAPPLAPPLPKKRSRRWQWAIAPLLGISMLLHVGLLFIPFPTVEDTPDEIAADEPEEEADIPVDILSLSEIAAPEPPAEPPAEPSPESPQPSPSQPQPPPPRAVPPPPEPAPAQDLLPEEDSFAEEAEPPVEEGLGETPPAFDAGVATEQFVGDISGLGVVDYTAQFGLPEPAMPRNPGNAVCFIDPTGGPMPGVRVANWLDKEPQTLLRENLQEVYGPRGITFEELDPFCGERYFQAVTAAGQPFMTISLVTLEGSTLLVVWETPPQ